MHKQVAGCSLLMVALIAASAARGQEADGYADERYGFGLKVAAPWKNVPAQGYSVPGVIRAVWKGPSQSSIVAFVQEPGKPYDARFLLDASAKALMQSLGAEAVASEVKKVADMQAMWLIVKGKGTGGALDGKGNVQTIQHWVAIPRGDEVVVVLFTCPATEHPMLKNSFDQALKGLKLTGKQTDEQSQAK